MNSDLGQLKESLLGLYQSNRPFLGAYAWEWEKDRWNELIFAVLREGLPLSTDLARRAVGAMDQLGISSPSTLSGADAEAQAFIKRVLCQVGVSPETSAKAVTILMAFSHLVNKEWAGYVQRFLREEGRRMVKRLQLSIVKCGVESQNAERAATLWLQNVANCPLLLQGEAVEQFRSRCSVSQDELVDVADELGINLSILDDLLALEADKGSSVG